MKSQSKNIKRGKTQFMRDSQLFLVLYMISGEASAQFLTKASRVLKQKQHNPAGIT